MRGAGLGRGAAVLAAVFVLAGSILLSTAGSPGNTVARSVGNTEDNGRRAAFLLLEELGFEPEVWNRRPGLLPRGAHVLVLPQVPLDAAEHAQRAVADEVEAETGDVEAGELEPEELGTDAADGESQDATEAVDDAYDLVRAAGLRAPRHYRRFLEQGGRVVVALDQAMLDFLRDELGLELFAGAEALELEPAPTRVELVAPLGGEQLELDVAEPSRLDELGPGIVAESLANDPAGEPLVVEVPVGRGGLVLLASDSFLDNDALRDADHARLLVRLVEGLDRGGRLLFDESALGLARPESRVALAFTPDTRLLSLHALALLLAAVWLLAWPREFPRDPVPHAAVAPVARARAQASLALRAGHPETLASLLRTATLRRLMRRARLSPVAGETLEHALGRWTDQRSDLPRAHVAQLRELFESREVRSREDLAQLDTELRALEAVATGAHERTTPPTSERSA